MLTDEEVKLIAERLIKQITVRRKELGLSQRDLAERIGVKQSTIARIETFKTNPRLDTIDSICKELGLKPVLTPKSN